MIEKVNNVSSKGEYHVYNKEFSVISQLSGGLKARIKVKIQEDGHFKIDRLHSFILNLIM